MQTLHRFQKARQSGSQAHHNAFLAFLLSELNVQVDKKVGWKKEKVFPKVLSIFFLLTAFSLAIVMKNEDKRNNKREKQIRSEVNDLGKEEDTGEVKAERKREDRYI